MSFDQATFLQSKKNAQSQDDNEPNKILGDKNDKIDVDYRHLYADETNKRQENIMSIASFFVYAKAQT